MKSLKKVGLTILLWTLPLAAAAQGGLGQVQTIAQTIRQILNIVIYIMLALLFIYFIWGVIQYVSAGGDEEKLKSGKQHMLWGVIGIAVVGAVYGIAQWLYGVFGINQAAPGGIPQF